MITLSRKIHFSSGHKYHNPNWSDQKNKDTFGSSYSEHGHGHNYTLEAEVTGPIDAETGMVMNLADLDAILTEVTDLLDHKFLNTDVEHFKSNMPTTENIVKFCYDHIINHLKNSPELKLHKVRLYESTDLWADYYG